MGDREDVRTTENFFQTLDNEVFEGAASLEGLKLGAFQEVVWKFHGGAHT